PQGLAGQEIPLAARLMAIADVYDALISKRVYKEAFSHDKAVGIITAGRQCHFDPQITDAFVRLEKEFQSIAARHQG
ncbi:MAG: two-component system response regulator, partial [Deltaproteobacteria bacterium]|nr:two-component system response regulator [Deltaproteobacteria bacterium]